MFLFLFLLIFINMIVTIIIIISQKRKSVNPLFAEANDHLSTSLIFSIGSFLRLNSSMARKENPIRLSHHLSCSP